MSEWLPLAALAALLLWHGECNRRTFEERAWLWTEGLERLSPGEREELAGWLRATPNSYDRHLARRFFGRDPWAIYPPCVRREAARRWGRA